jgi:hypothetical protein
MLTGATRIATAVGAEFGRYSVVLEAELITMNSDYSRTFVE